MLSFTIYLHIYLHDEVFISNYTKIEIIEIAEAAAMRCALAYEYIDRMPWPYVYSG